jgi:hypothetical protein
MSQLDRSRTRLVARRINSFGVIETMAFSPKYHRLRKTLGSARSISGNKMDAWISPTTAICATHQNADCVATPLSKRDSNNVRESNDD